MMCIKIRQVISLSYVMDNILAKINWNWLFWVIYWLFRNRHWMYTYDDYLSECSLLIWVNVHINDNFVDDCLNDRVPDLYFNDMDLVFLFCLEITYEMYVNFFLYNRIFLISCKWFIFVGLWGFSGGVRVVRVGCNESNFCRKIRHFFDISCDNWFLNWNCGNAWIF